jgi:Cu-Zn family superoxide dismutase
MPRSLAAVAALLTSPVVVLGACSTNQSSEQTTSSPTGAAPPGTERLTTQLKTADGAAVADATFDFADGYATVTVNTVNPGDLTPGLHALHIHSIGNCAGNDFDSAGGHFQAPGHTSEPASGDLPALQVRSNGEGTLVTTTDAFTASDLLAGQKTSLIVHDGKDDSTQRLACGVIDSTTATSVTTTTTTAPTTQETVTVTTTVQPPPPSPTTTSPNATTSTSTSTATITVPTVTLTPVNPPGDQNPGG